MALASAGGGAGLVDRNDTIERDPQGADERREPPNSPLDRGADWSDDGGRCVAPSESLKAELASPGSWSGSVDVPAPGTSPPERLEAAIGFYDTLHGTSLQGVFTALQATHGIHR